MPKNKETLKFRFLSFKKRFTSKGFISPINLIGITFLIISLFVGIVAVTKKDSNFDIRKLAKSIIDTEVVVKKTSIPVSTKSPEATTKPSSTCSSGSTCRYGLTDCGSGYEKTGTCSGGVCCKAQSTTTTTSSCQSDSDCSSGYFCQSGVCKKTAQGIANVGTATAIPTPIAVGTAGVGITTTPTITSSSCQTNDDCNTGYYCQGGECKKEVVTTISTSSTCSSGSTCRYGLTDCGSGYEKTGTCSGGVCCKAQSTTDKVTEGTANVGINTPLPTTSSTSEEGGTIADLYTSSTGKKTDSIIDQKIEEIISGNSKEKSCNVSSSFGECGQGGCKENQVLKIWIASDCSKTSVCVYSSDCESTKLADDIVESDSKVVDVGAGFNISQWFSENVIDKILSLFKTKDELEKQATPTPIAQGTANVGAVTTNEAFCDPNLEKDCLYSCEPTFDGGKCKKKSSIVSEEVVENQTSVIDNQGLISEKVLEKFELSSLISGKKSCSNNYKAGEIVIWSGYVQGCDGATGEWVNLSSKGYGPEVLTVVPSWLTPESNTWKSLISASKLAPSYVNSDGEFVEPEKEKWCNTDSGGVPSGTVSLGGLGVRSRCNNGEWKACSDDPNDVSNYCSLTLVPSYIKNSKEELEKLETETQIYEQNISNYLVLYQEKYQECTKNNANECLSEANQFLVNEGLSKEIAETIRNQFVNQMTLYANLTPVLEDYQDCLSIKSESECVDERALVTKVAGFTNVDTNLLVQSTSEYISTEYQDLVSQYIDLKFKVINCSNSEGSLNNFSSECKNILNKLTQIERNPIFKYFEARDKMVNCNSFEECKYWEEQMSKISEDEIFGNVSDFELIAKNYLSPERIFEQAVTKNLYIQKAVQALYFNDDYALREACLMENLSSPNKCLGNLDTYKNSVLEQLTDEEKNIIQEYQEKYTYLDENIKTQISSVPYTACTRSGGYYSASTLSCSKGYSCLSGFCVPDKGTETEELTLSEGERQKLLSEVSSKQSYCNSVLPGSLYERTTNLCVLETSNVPKVVSIGREVTNSYNCSKSEYFYNDRCYLKEESAYDLLVGTSGFGNFVEKYEEKLAKCRDEAINNGKVACEGDTYSFKSSKTNQNLLIQEELSLEVDPDDRLNWYGENTSLLLEIAKIAAIKDIKGGASLSEYYLEGEGVIDDEKLIEEGILDQVEEKAWVYLKANVRNTSTTVFGFKLDDGYSIADEVAVNVSYLEKYSEKNGLNFAELVSLNYKSSFNVDENNNLVKTGVVLEEMSGSLVERMGANLINQGKLNEAQSERAFDWFDSLVNPDNPEYIYNQVYGNGVNSISSSLSLAGEGIDFTTSYSDWIKENPVRETLFDYASESSFEYAQTVQNNSGYRFASTAETIGAVVIGMVSGVVKPAGPTGFAIGTAIEVGGDLVLHGIVDASTQNTKERFVEKINADENINQSIIAQVNNSIVVSKVGEYVQVAIFDIVANAAGETLSKFVAGKGIVDRFEDSLVFSIGRKVDPSVVYSLGDEVWDSSRVLVQNELGEIVEVSSKEEALELLSKNYANWTIADNVVQSNAKDLLISAKNSNLGSIFTSYSEKKIVQNISEELTSNQRVIFETLSNVDEVLSGSEKSILRTWIDNRNALRAPTEETLKAGQDITLKGEYNIKLQNGLSIDPQKAADEGLNITIVGGSKVKFSGSALDYLEAINTGKLVLSADDLVEFGAEVAVRNQVGEELSESTLKSFSGIDSISYPNYIRLANGDKIILGASSDDIKLAGVKAGNVVEIVKDGKLTRGVVGIQGDVSELTGFSAFAVSNQKGLRLVAGIDIDSGKFKFTDWIKNGVFADDVPLGKLANQVDELFESGETKVLRKEVNLLRDYHSKGLVDYEYNIIKNVDGEEIGVSGFKINVSDEIDPADRELILQRASKIEKSSEDLVIKYDAVMRSSNKMSPITEVELKNGTVLTKALDESDSDFAYRIANLRIESPDDFIDAKIITKSGKDTNFFSWRIDEAGDTIQPDVILDAVLTPGTKIIGAPTGLGKSIVALENIAILKKEILGSDTKITVILKSSDDLNDFTAIFDKRAAEFFGFNSYIMDQLPPDPEDLVKIKDANFFVGTSDTIFNSLEDSGMGNKLIQSLKGSVLIGDEGHISLRSDIDYIKSTGGSLVIEPTRASRFQELFDPDDGLLRELTNGHLEDLRLNQKSSQIVDILDANGNVIKEGFSDEVREKAYRVMIESRLKDFSDVSELKVLLESDDLVTSLEEFLNVPRITDSKISEVIQALSEDISALNSVEKVLIDVPVNGYDFVENAKTFVDKNGVGDKISAVVPKENNVPTGRQYSQIDDELAYQYLGRKFLGIPVDDIGELNLFVTPDSIGTNYGRFLKETFNLDESVVLTATPRKIQNQWLNRFGITTSLYGTTKQDIPERLLTNLQENFVSFRNLDEIETNIAIVENSPNVYVIGANKTNNNEILSRIQRRSVGAGRDLAIISGSGDVYLYKTGGEKVLISDGLLGIEALESTYKEEGKVLDVVYELGRNYATDLNTLPESKFITIFDSSSDVTDFVQTIGRDRCKGGCRNLAIVFLGDQEISSDTFLELITKNETDNLAKISVSDVDGEIKNAGYRFIQRLQELDNQKGLGNLFRGENSYDEIYRKWRLTSDLDTTVKAAGVTPEEYIVQQTNRLQSFINELYEDTSFRNSLSKKAQEFLAESYGDLFNASDISLLTVAKNIDNLSPLSNSVNAKELIESVNSTFSASDFPERVVSKNLSSGQVKVLQDVQSEVQESLTEEQSKKTTASKVQDTLNKIKLNTKNISSNISNTVGNIPILKTTRDFIVLGPKGWIKVIGNSKVIESFKSIFTKKDSELESELIIDESSKDYPSLEETQPTEEEKTKIEKEVETADKYNKLKDEFGREFDKKNNIQYLGYTTDSYLSQKGIVSSKPKEQSLLMKIESGSGNNEATLSLINTDSESIEVKVNDEIVKINVAEQISITVNQKVEVANFGFTFVGTENSTGLERVKLQILGSSNSIKATDKGIEVKRDFFLVGLIKGLFKGIQKGFSFVFDKVINLVKPETRQKVINVGSSFVKKERKVEIKLNFISRALLKFDEFQNKDKGLYKIINAKPFKLRWIISRTLLPEIFGYYDLTRLGVNFAIKILKIKPQETIINIGGETEQMIFEEDEFIVVPDGLLLLPAPGQTSVPEKSLLAEQQEKLKFALDEIEKQAEERRSTEAIISEIIRNIRIRSHYKGVLNIIPPLEYLLDFNLLTQNYYLLTVPSQEEYIKTLKESKALLEEAENQIEEVQKKDYEDYLNEIGTLERGQLKDQRLQEYLNAVEKISEARRKLELFIKENPVLSKVLDDSVKLLPASDEYYDLIEKANQEAIQKAEEMKQNALKEHKDLLEQVKKLSIDFKQSPFEVPKDIGKLATESIQSLNAQIKSYIAEVNKLREETKIFENIEEGVSRKLASEWQDLWLGKFDDFVINNEEKIKNSLSEYNYSETRINEATKIVAAKTYEYVKEEIQSYLQEEKKFDLINSVNLGTDIKYKELGNQEINISQILDAPNITDWSSITLKSFSNNRWESLFEFIQQTKDGEIDENDSSLSIELRHLGGGVYEVITGTYRVMAAKAAGVKTITAKVYEFEDASVLREPWNYIADSKGDMVSKAKSLMMEVRVYVSLLPEFDTEKYQRLIEDLSKNVNEEEKIQAINNIIYDLSNTINEKITSALDGEYKKVNEKTNIETEEKLRSVIITYIRKYTLYLKDSKYINNEIRYSLIKSDLLKKDPNLIDQYSRIIEEILISETDKFVASQINPDYLAIKLTSDAKTKGSTVAVGDVHGDWNALVRVLSGQEKTKEGKVVQKVLLDKNGNWIGGENDQLILTGDLFDRAPKGVLSSQTVEKIMNLQKKAGNLPNGQPRIMILIGNHDVNAILAYWRMVRSIKSGNSLRDAAEEVSINMEMRPSISTEDLLYLYQHSDLVKWVMNLPAIFVKDENIYMHSDNQRYLEYGRSVDEINKNIYNLLNGSSTIAFSIRVTGIDGIERSKTLLNLMEDLTERRKLSSRVVTSYLQIFKAQRIIHGHSQGDIPEDSRVVNIDGGLSEGYASRLGQNRARFFEYEAQGETKLVVEKLKASPQTPTIDISEEYLNKLNQIGEKSSVNEKDTASVIEEERQKLINEYEEALKRCRELDSDSSLDYIIVLKNIEEQPNSRISYQINLINEEITKLEELKDRWEKAKTDYLNALETLKAISPADVLLNKIDYEKIPYRDYDSIEARTKIIIKKISTDRKDILINQFKNDLNALKILNSPFLSNLAVSDITKNFSGGTAAVYSVITFDKEKQITKKIIAKVYFDVEGESALKEQKVFDLVSEALHNGEYSLSKEVSYVPEFYHFDEANKILFMEYAKEKMDLTKPVDLAYLVQLAHFGYLLRQSGVVPKDYKFNDNLYINSQQLKVIDIGLYDDSLDGQESHYRNFIKDLGDLLGTYTGVSFFEFQNELSQKTDEEVVKIVNSKNIPNWTKYLILFSRGLIKGQTDQSSIEGYKDMLFDIVTVAKENGVSEDQIPESLREIYNNKEEIDKNNDKFNNQGGTSVKSEVIKQTEKKVGNSIKKVSNFGKTLFSILISGSIIFTILGTLFGFNFLSIPKTDISINEPVPIVSEMKVQKDSSSLNSSESQRYGGILSLNRNNVVNVSFSSEGQVSYNFESYSNPYTLIPDYYYDEILPNIANSDDFCSNVDSCKLKLKQIPIISHINNRVQVDSDFGENLSFIELSDEFTWFPTTNWNSNSKVRSDVGDEVKSFLTQVTSLDSSYYVKVRYGYRSYSEQKLAYEKQTTGDIARQGFSQHQSGLAIDLDTNVQLDELTTIANKNGFVHPFTVESGWSDPPHWFYLDGIYPGLTQMIKDAGQNPNDINVINEVLLGLSQTYEAKIRLLEESNSGQNVTDVSQESRESASLLSETAEKYIANSQKQTTQVSAELLTVNNSDGSVVCGPLAASLMKDGGYLDSTTDVHDFFLLNDYADQGLIFLKKILSEEKYEWFRTSTSVANFDFSLYPLQPGDLLYLKGGTFTHWLTITRIDEEGKIYAVTNIAAGYINGNKNDDSFLIQEIMLYDPKNPEDGQFTKWASYDYPKLGRTGTEGFRLWRLKGEGKSNNFSAVLLNSSLIPFLNAQTFQKISEKYIYSKWPEMEEKGVLPVLYQKIKEKIINSKNVVSNIESDENTSAEPTTKEQILASSLAIAKEYKPNSCSNCGTLLNDLDTQLQLFRNAETGKEQLDSLKKARELLSNHAIDNQVVYASGQLLTDAEIYSTFRVNHDGFKDSVRLLIKNIDRAMNEDLLVEIKKLLILLKSRLIEMQVRFNLEDIDLEDDEVKRMIKYITGIDYVLGKESLLRDRLLEDHDIVKSKYNLPDSRLRSDSPSEYISKLEEIGKKHDISIRNNYEMEVFFRGNEQIKAVFMEKSNEIFVPLVNKNNYKELIGYAENLEHELIHALQHKYYPNLPVEAMEYEAYVGANVSIEYLKEFPLDSIEKDFNTIKSSIEYWYESNELIAPWSNEVKKVDNISEKTNKTNEIIPVTGQGQIKEVIFKDQINTDELKKKFEEGFFKGLLTKDGIFVVGFSRHDVIADWIDEKFPEYKNDQDSIIAAYDSGRIILMPTSKEINFEVFLPDFASDLLSMGISDEIECEVIGGVTPFMGLIEYDAKLKDISEGINFERIKSNIVINGYLGEEVFFNSKFIPVTYQIVIGNKFESDKYGQFMISNFSKKDGLYYIKFENRDNEVWTERRMIAEFGEGKIKKIGSRREDSSVNINHFDELKKQFISTLYDDVRIRGFLTDKNQVYWTTKNVYLEQLKINSVLLNREVVTDFEYSPTGQIFYVNGSSSGVSKLMDEFIKAGVGKDMPIFATVDGVNLSKLGIESISDLTIYLEDQKVVN